MCSVSDTHVITFNNSITSFAQIIICVGVWVSCLMYSCLQYVGLLIWCVIFSVVIFNSASLCRLLQVPNMCLQDPSPLQNKLPMLIDEKLNSTWGIQWNFVLHDNQGIPTWRWWSILKNYIMLYWFLFLSRIF